MVDDARAESAYEAQRDRNLLEQNKKMEELRLRTCANEYDKISQPKKKSGKVLSCLLQFVLLLSCFWLHK